MTAPVWIASPPEVHSALLTSGPGAGPLLAAAAAWNALGTQYAEIADELGALLGAVRTGAWQGPTATAYAAANAPYLTWLLRAGADSTASAAQLETAATAYTVALAAMPTLAELAANHATHAVLMATNFFGVNTIPIALNEADYARMWVQAATVMSSYHAVAAAAVVSVPQTGPAPRIVEANAAAAADSPPPDRTDQVMQWLQQTGYTDFYNNVLQPLINVVSANPYLQLLFSGFDPYLLLTGNPFSFFSPFNVGFAVGYPMTISQFVVFLSQTFGFIGADLTAAFASGNPATIGFTLIFTGIEAVGTVITDVIALLKSLLEPTLALIPAMLPMLTMPLAPIAAVTPSVLGGLAGLAGLHAIPAAVVPPAVLPPVALALGPTPAPVPAVAPAPPVLAAAPAPAAPIAPPPPPPAPPLAPVNAFGYLVGGMYSDARRAASGRARRTKTPQPDSAAEPAAAAAAEEQARTGRRRRVKTQMVGRGYEYMDLEPELSTASQRGTGPLGFAGTAPRAAVLQPAGLTVPAEDSFGRRAVTPMMPGGWRDPPPEAES